MIFELVDGRKLLYQWDLNRKLHVNDKSIKEVHFCNRTGECSLVVEVVDEMANIPNILLQSSFDIRVFGYDGEATLHEEVFKVKTRTKPAGYVYTETEVLRYEELNRRINDLEENLESTVVNEVNKYMEENPVTANCSTYYFNPYAIEWQTGRTPTPAPEDLAEFAQKYLAGEQVNLVIAYKYPSGTITWLPAEFSRNSNDYIQINRILYPGDFGKETEIQNYLVHYNETRELWVVNRGGSYIYFYPDKKYVDDAIANIDVPEGAVSYLEEQELTEEQQGIARKNLDLPYMSTGITVDGPYTNTLYNQAGYRYFGGEFSSFRSLAVGKRFTLTLEVPAFDITETIECEITSLDVTNGITANYTVLTDCTDLVFFSGEDYTVNETRVYIRKKDTSHLYTGATSASITVKTTTNTPMNKLEAELVDLDNYYTKEETAQAIQNAINAIGVAEGGAY